MAANREIACEYYRWEGECSKGKKGTFRDACQTCKKYKPRRGGLPARRNTKKEKLKAEREREIRREMREY